MTQRESHKKSTSGLRTTNKELCKKVQSMAKKYTKIAAHLVNISSNECSVCLEEFDGKKEPHMMNCIHIICKVCALSWLEKSKTNSTSCPICRTGKVSALTRQISVD